MSLPHKIFDPYQPHIGRKNVTVQFRHATPTDAHILAEIGQCAVEQKNDKERTCEPERAQYVSSDAYNLSYLLSESGYSDGMTTTNVNAILASVNDKAVGYILYETTIDSALKFNSVSVEHVYVTEHEVMILDRKDKIEKPFPVGQSLYKKFMGLQQSVNDVSIFAITEAIPFYQKMGCEITKDDDNDDSEEFLARDMIMPQDNIDAWHMSPVSLHKRPQFKA